jgi:AraC-like DNA-binding protein/CheY-like chemotaxis protein
METGRQALLVVRNITGDTNDAYVQSMRDNGFRIRQVPAGQSPLSVMEREAPLVVCFQYDYPDLPGLAELRLVKERMPSVPLIMITQAHSESLAVWAFRAGVRDYFVQPVDVERFLSVLKALSGIRAGGERRRRPLWDAMMPPNVIPPEARVPGNSAGGNSGALGAVEAYVARNLHRKIVQSEVAESCGLSPFQFSRLFKRRYDMTFQEFVQNMRIEAAKRMLEHPGASVTDVCFNVGFHDLSYFTRTFQRYVGDTPSHYRVKAMRQQKAAASAQPVSGAVPEQIPADTRPLSLTLDGRDAG